MDGRGAGRRRGAEGRRKAWGSFAKAPEEIAVAFHVVLRIVESPVHVFRRGKTLVSERAETQVKQGPLPLPKVLREGLKPIVQVLDVVTGRIDIHDGHSFINRFWLAVTDSADDVAECYGVSVGQVAQAMGRLRNLIA